MLILAVLGAILFLRNRGSSKQYDSLNMNYAMNQQSYVNYQQHATTQQQQVSIQPQSVQADPAIYYYQSLRNQGYPHEHAVAYTKQYYPQFNG